MKKVVNIKEFIHIITFLRCEIVENQYNYIYNVDESQIKPL